MCVAGTEMREFKISLSEELHESAALFFGGAAHQFLFAGEAFRREVFLLSINLHLS
jgi:hypothetical protein